MNNTAQPQPATGRAKRTVSRKDLPLCCPMHGETLWNMHPRVYLAIEQTGHARCPYCSTDYELKD